MSYFTDLMYSKEVPGTLRINITPETAGEISMQAGDAKGLVQTALKEILAFIGIALSEESDSPPTNQIISTLLWCLSEFADLAAVLEKIEEEAEVKAKEAQS